MVLEFVPLPEYGVDRAAAVLARGFSDYLVKLALTPAVLTQMVRVDSVDPTLSRVILRNGAAMGVVLIARRGWTCRLAGMALVPEGRRQGWQMMRNV